MIVYLIGHGFVASEFPQIDIPKECDLKFYVPEGKLPEKAIEEMNDKEKEEYCKLQNDCMYGGNRTPYYIWSGGESLKTVDDLEIKEDMLKYETNYPIKPLKGGEKISEHLIMCVDYGTLKKIDLKDVVLSNSIIEDIDEKPFKFCEVNNIIIDGKRKDLDRGSRYVVSPSWSMLASPYHKNTVYRLSWLMNNIIKIITNYDLAPEEDKSIHICWLACRYAMEGADCKSFKKKAKKLTKSPNVSVTIEHIFPKTM